MNGFVNTLLSVGLSWIRALISQIWSLLSSEDGGAFFRFFGENWLGMVICLCVVCVAVDGIVYFFRWRPDYVWASRWRRLRRKPADRLDEVQEETPALQEESAAESAAQTAAYAPLQAATSVYAPVSQPTQLWQPVQEEQDFVWGDEEPMELDWQADEEPAFGAPQPEPLAYFRDVQAGFAPAVPPEKLYTPSASYQPAAEMETVPVHPGLDEETFRQSVGLEQASPSAAPVMYAPAFRPFTAVPEAEPERPQGALKRFAQRARGLMALDDEQKSIRDLQSSVDISKAFHEPVYPQSFKHDEE